VQWGNVLGFRLERSQPKSEHIIALHESFQTQSTSWAILPEMSSVANVVWLAPKQPYGKVAQVCWGLIKGVGILHKFCIAHRDINPQDLVVDRRFCLLIIDFDAAMEVEDEDEVVYGQCGTKGWMVPEMVEKSMYSVDVQPDQGRPVVEQASYFLSSGQPRRRRHGFEDDCKEADGT